MKYHYIGSVSSDACPGLSQSWSIYIGRDKRDVFHVEYDSGDGFALGNVEEACEWIENNSGLLIVKPQRRTWKGNGDTPNW